MESNPQRCLYRLSSVDSAVLTSVGVSLQNSCVERMRIAVIGQSLFGQEVYKELRKDGHVIVGVFTIPDKDGKADPLGENSHCDAVGP